MPSASAPKSAARARSEPQPAGFSARSFSKTVHDFLLSALLVVISWALLIGGVIMWLVDALRNEPRIRRMDEMKLPHAVWIGACQIFSALFPGTSRSMSTIAAGELAGMSREAALEFSFFLSIPTMVVATSFDFYKAVLSHHSAERV